MITPKAKIIVNHSFFQEAKNQMQLCYDSFGCKTDPRCTPILGPSGCGKSTVIQEFVDSINKINGPRMKSIVVIETPSNPTVKTLASEVLKSIGDPMYYRGTEIQMTDRIVKLLKASGTRLLIFDELQNLIDRESDKLCFKASDWLKRLINISRLPTVIVGLDRTEELFLVNEQLRRRFTESYIIEPFCWDKPDTQKLLKGFLKALHKNFKFEQGLEIYSIENAFRFYCATGGLVGYIMAITREAERLADLMHSEAISMSHIAQAYNIAVCGNHLVGVNPFSHNNLEKPEVALRVVEDSKKLKRKDKVKTNL